MAGCYSADEAFGVIADWFESAIDGERQTETEIADAFCWAIAQEASGSPTDLRAEIDKRVPPRVEPGDIAVDWSSTSGGDPVQTALPFSDPPGPTNLPEEFWSARPTLGLIRAAAHSRGRSADAVLGSVLVRVAVLVHPSIRIPPTVGSWATLDELVAIVGPPGSGKSSAAAIAIELLPIENPRILTDRQLGSGEGIADAYLGAPDKAKQLDGTIRNVRPQIADALHIVVDEGQIVTDIGGRGGSTLLPTLRQAWSGVALGNTNADHDKHRHLPAASYRFAALILLQPTHASTLLEDQAGGTPQRLLWLSAVDPSIPEPAVRPTWPGQLLFDPPEPSTTRLGQTLTLTTSITAEVSADDLARNRGKVSIASLDGHATLVRLKIAALLAIMDNRLAVSDEDWKLAGVVSTTSNAVRDSIEQSSREVRQSRADEADRAHMNRAVRTEAALTDAAIVSGAQSIARRVGKSSESVTRGELRRSLNSTKRASVDDIVGHAVDNGWIVGDELQGYSAGSSKPA